MRSRTEVRVGVSTGADLIRHGVTCLLSQPDRTTGLHVRFAAPGWGPASVDVVLLDLTGHLPPPAEHFVATWTHRTPTLGLVVGTESDHHAAAVMGCHRSVALDASVPAYVSALTAVASGATGVSASALTERELQVVHLVASGFANTTVAALLIVSENTVKTYIRQAYRKIGARSRSQAARWAVLSGLGSGAARTALFGARDLDVEARALVEGRATGPVRLSPAGSPPPRTAVWAGPGRGVPGADPDLGPTRPARPRHARAG